MEISMVPRRRARRHRRRAAPIQGNSQFRSEIAVAARGDMQHPPVIRDDDWTDASPYYDAGYFFGSRALRQTPYRVHWWHTSTGSRTSALSTCSNSVREKIATSRQFIANLIGAISPILLTDDRLHYALDA